MKLDTQATRRARERQQAGIKRLNELFGYDPDKFDLVPRQGGWSLKQRREWVAKRRAERS